MGFDEDTMQRYMDVGTWTMPKISSSSGYRPIDGHIFAVSQDTQERRYKSDWALIGLHDQQSLRPNLLVLPDARQVDSDTDRELTECLPRLAHLYSDQPIHLISGTGGVKPGILSKFISYLALSAAKHMIATYSLSLLGGLGKMYQHHFCDHYSPAAGFSAGDGGSWVINAHTCEVLGHVVAVDICNEVYVIPLETIFRNIENQLPAKSVRLANKADIQQWLDTSQHWNWTNIEAELFGFPKSGEHQTYPGVVSNTASLPLRPCVTTLDM